MLLPPGGFKSQKNNSRTPCVPMFIIIYYLDNKLANYPVDISHRKTGKSEIAGREFQDIAAK